MDHDTLAALADDALAEYLWRRLRMELPLAPPLNRRHRMEPPEAFVIKAWERASDQESLRERLGRAIKANLERIGPLTSAPDPVTAEQVSSLAYLAAAVEPPGLLRDFFDRAKALMTACSSSELLLFHLLRATARLQEGDRLTWFWQDIIISSGLPAPVRAIGWYGLSRADGEQVGNQLNVLADDPEVDVSLVMWHLTRETPGVNLLAQAARSVLSRPQRDRLTQALIKSGADEALVKTWQGRSMPFEFSVMVIFCHALRFPAWKVGDASDVQPDVYKAGKGNFLFPRTTPPDRVPPQFSTSVTQPKA